MSKALHLKWRVALLVCAVSSTVIFNGNADCLAKTHAALSTHKHKIQTKTNKKKKPAKIDKTALQLQQMQQLLNKYSQRLADMQINIATLKAQINKTQSIATVNLNNPEPEQDIGSQLIFGPEDKASTPSSAVKNVSTLAAETRVDVANPAQSNEITGRMGRSFNPDIVVAGIFSGNYADKSDIPDRNKFRLDEGEFGFSSYIDPYAKGTIIFSKPDNVALDIEEGYVTLLNLPWGLQSKVGEFKGDFGKLNLLHSHDLPQADLPDVLTNFFGSESLTPTGINLSKILPTPWYSDITLEVGNSDNQPLFGHASLTKPLTIEHYKNFFNLSENKTLEIGLSNALGSRDVLGQSPLSAVQGIDVTYNWLPSNLSHTLKWQTEFLASELEHVTGQASKSAYFGGYSYLEYKLNNRWSLGTRVDCTQVPLVANASEMAVVPYINYSLSEFGKLRLEYKHTFGHNFESSDRAWLQYVVIMGAHPPHTM